MIIVKYKKNYRDETEEKSLASVIKEMITDDDYTDTLGVVERAEAIGESIASNLGNFIELLYEKELLSTDDVKRLVKESRSVRFRDIELRSDKP